MLHEITWEDFDAFAKSGGVIVLPVGSTEQHGPHLPLGSDTIIATEIAKDLAKGRQDVMVAPSIAWGFKPQPGSSGGQDFPGTLSLDGNTLSLLVRDFVSESLRHRIKKIIILDGHYENSLFLNEGIDLALRDRDYPSNVKVLIVRWFELLSQAEFEKIFPGFEGVALEHAANMETALMLHFRPELVKKEKILHGDRAEKVVPYTVLPPYKELIPKTGVLTVIKRTPTAQQGSEMASLLRQRLEKILKSEFDLS
jgi:creatinine amidohydrolase